jgi:hypothetical protein
LVVSIRGCGQNCRHAPPAQAPGDYWMAHIA